MDLDELTSTELIFQEGFITIYVTDTTFGIDRHTTQIQPLVGPINTGRLGWMTVMIQEKEWQRLLNVNRDSKGIHCGGPSCNIAMDQEAPIDSNAEELMLAKGCCRSLTLEIV